MLYCKPFGLGCEVEPVPIVINHEGDVTMANNSEDKRIYKVVVNHEEQYSLWFADRKNPSGWKDAGKSGTKGECLSYVEQVWTDMTPLSLRKKEQKVD